jgi:DNA polymerase III subunit epsilon
VAAIFDTHFVAIDFESAGTAPGQGDVPVQVGMAELRPGLELGEQFRSYIATDRPVTWAASKVHGIMTSDLQGAPEMNTLWPEFKRLLKDRVVVAHGAATEKRFLRAFPMHGFGPWVDSLSLSRAMLPDLEDHSLGSVCAALGVVEEVSQGIEHLTWHDALYDAVASVVLVKALVERTGIGGEDVQVLIDVNLDGYYQARRERGA